MVKRLSLYEIFIQDIHLKDQFECSWPRSFESTTGQDRSLESFLINPKLHTALL